MKKIRRSAKDSIALITLSVITIAGIGFFIVNLWSPDLLKKDDSEEKYNISKETEYDDAGIPKITPKELKGKMSKEDNFVLLDVQNTEDYIQASIPTAISMPLTEIDQRYEELPKNKEIIATDAGGNCQECSRAVEILKNYGIVDVKKLEGGVNAWADAGYPVLNGNEVTYQNVNAEGLLDMIDAGEDAVIIDVRDEAKYNQKHIVGAVHIPFEGLSDHIEDISTGKKIIIYDDMGNRSKIAVKQFVSKGYIDVINLIEGFKSWEENDYPVES